MIEFVLWHLHEDIVGKQFLLVRTKELLVEGKGSAGFTLDVEVSHLLASLFVLVRVLDHDHGGVEGLGDVLLDLGLLRVLESNTGLFLEGLSDLDGSHLLLGEIVQVDELLSLSVHCSVFYFFDLRVSLEVVFLKINYKFYNQFD